MLPSGKRTRNNISVAAEIKHDLHSRLLSMGLKYRSSGFKPVNPKHKPQGPKQGRTPGRAED